MSVECKALHKSIESKNEIEIRIWENSSKKKKQSSVGGLKQKGENTGRK